MQNAVLTQLVYFGSIKSETERLAKEFQRLDIKNTNQIDFSIIQDCIRIYKLY